MIRTIITGSRVLVQGIFVRLLANGKMAVRIGDRIYIGTPVNGEKDE